MRSAQTRTARPGGEQSALPSAWCTVRIAGHGVGAREQACATVTGARGSDIELDAVNRVVSQSTLSWGLSGRVRRIALPSLMYQAQDLEHMALMRFDRPEAGAIAVAAWQAAQCGEVPGATRAMDLHGLYVLPAWQRRGIGRSVLDFGEDWVRARGCDGIALRAWRGSEMFFRAHGFRDFHAADTLDQYPRRMWKAI